MIDSAFLEKFHTKHLELDATPGNTSFLTYMGHAFDIFNPDTWVFDLQDMAIALGNTCRFGGHVSFYSVAEHSVRVARWLEDEGYPPLVQLLGLMHDGIEAYIGDIIRPIKKYADLGGESVMDLERSMEFAMFGAFDLLTPDFEDLWVLVKKADMAVFVEERAERPIVGRGLMPNDATAEWMKNYVRLNKALI